jgi:hypothetical protein
MTSIDIEWIYRYHLSLLWSNIRDISSIMFIMYMHDVLTTAKVHTVYMNNLKACLLRQICTEHYQIIQIYRNPYNNEIWMYIVTKIWMIMAKEITYTSVCGTKLNK